MLRHNVRFTEVQLSGVTYQAAFQQAVWVVSHDFTILAGTGLALVGVDDEVLRPAQPRGSFDAVGDARKV